MCLHFSRTALIMTFEKIFKFGTERPAKSLIAYGRSAPVLLCVLPGIGKALFFCRKGIYP